MRDCWGGYGSGGFEILHESWEPEGDTIGGGRVLKRTLQDRRELVREVRIEYEALVED